MTFRDLRLAGRDKKRTRNVIKLVEGSSALVSRSLGAFRINRQQNPALANSNSPTGI